MVPWAPCYRNISSPKKIFTEIAYRNGRYPYKVTTTYSLSPSPGNSCYSSKVLFGRSRHCGDQYLFCHYSRYGRLSNAGADLWTEFWICENRKRVGEKTHLRCFILINELFLKVVSITSGLSIVKSIFKIFKELYLVLKASFW